MKMKCSPKRNIVIWIGASTHVDQNGAKQKIRNVEIVEECGRQ